MDPNRITAVSNWTVNARTVIARRYVCSTLAAERPDCLQSVAKALASRGSSRLCQQLLLGEEHIKNTILEKNILFKLLTRFRFVIKFKSNYQIFFESLSGNCFMIYHFSLLAFLVKFDRIKLFIALITNVL